MATIVQQRLAGFTPRLWAVLADPSVRLGIAAIGAAAAAAGGLILATSGILLDPVEFGLQVALMLGGTVAAALVWLRRRPGNRVALLLLALAVATSLLALEGADDELLHSLGILVGILAEPVFFLLGYAVVFAFPDGRLNGRAERLSWSRWRSTSSSPSCRGSCSRPSCRAGRRWRAATPPARRTVSWSPTGQRSPPRSARISRGW